MTERSPYSLDSVQLEKAVQALQKAAETLRPNPSEKRLYCVLGICVRVAAAALAGLVLTVAVFLGVTPFVLFLGLVSAGAGHGDYFLAKILFPYTLLYWQLFTSSREFFYVVAIIQYPAYGLLMGVANLNRKFLIVGVALAIVHIACVVGSFYVANPSFSGRFR